MAQVAGAGAGDVDGSESRNDSSRAEERDQRYMWEYTEHVPLELTGAIFQSLRVHLGDGITRTRPGVRLEHTEMDYARRWTDTNPDEDRPAHPPMLESGKKWRFIEPHGLHYSVVPEAETTEASASSDIDALFVETQKIRRPRISEADVVVFREGMAFPTRELISVVNTAHAVLVLREENEYFYLHDDFVLSAREEEALMEWEKRWWGPTNSVLAVYGTLAVAIVENAWAPAVVGTLLVATATYRVQGVLTKLMRIRSSEWKTKHKLVPSGIHGTERVIQGILVTLVAFADLLDNRMMLLTALVLASVQVVSLESARINPRLSLRVEYPSGVPSSTYVIFTWLFTVGVSIVLIYSLFNVVFDYMCFGLVVFSVYMPVMAGCLGDWSRDKDDRRFKGRWITVPMALVSFGSVGVGILVTVLHWDDADMKGSSQSGWWGIMSRGLDYFSTGVSILGDLVAIFALFIDFAVFCTLMGFMASSLNPHRRIGVTGLGDRTRERKKEDSPGFSHYDENPIPSRNLLVAGVGQPAPVASIV